MLNFILPMIQNQPNLKRAVEQLFGQPVEHVAGCVGIFMEQIGKGPGLVNTEAEKLAMFNRIFHGGRSLGFSDWESELAAARIAGYSDLDICISFRERHQWPQTTVENIQALAEQVMPRFVEAGKKAGLLPPDMFPNSGIPQIDITTSGGAAPWESLIAGQTAQAGNERINHAPDN